MRLIYENAEEVIVFMGDGKSHRVQRADLRDPPIYPARKFFGDHRDETFLATFLETCHSKPEELGSPGTAALCAMSLVRLFSDQSKMEHICRELLKLGDETRRHLFEHLRSFVVWPWWSRIWVVQEVAVSKVAVIQFGNISANWEVFVKAANVISSARRESPALAALETENTKVLEEFKDKLLNLEQTRRRWHADGGTDLGHLLQQFSNCKASDDRDKVYGLLGLAKKGHGIRPDYRLDVLETYRNSALSIIHANASLACWAGDQQRKNRPGLPSWIPDWSTGLDPADRRRAAHVNMYNVNCGWRLQIFRRMGKYLPYVSRQLKLFTNSLAIRKKQLPMSLLPLVEQYANNFQERLASLGPPPELPPAVRSLRVHKDDVVEILQSCDRLVRFCSKCLKEHVALHWLKVPHDCPADSNCEIGSTSDRVNPWKLFRTSCAFQLEPDQIRLVPERLRCQVNAIRIPEDDIGETPKTVLALQTVRLERIEKVGARMFGWSDTEAAAETLIRWICLISIDNNPILRLDHGRLLDFAKTIMGGISPPCGSHQEIDESELRPFLHWLKRLVLRIQGVRYDESGRVFEIPRAFARFPLSRSPEFPAIPSPFFESVELATDGRVFFVSKSGVTGLGPGSTRPGDTVHILPSGSSHFVLRLNESSHGELIGDCYLHTDERLESSDAEEKDAVIQGSLPYEMLSSYKEGLFGKIEVVALQ